MRNLNGQTGCVRTSSSSHESFIENTKQKQLKQKQKQKVAKVRGFYERVQVVRLNPNAL